MLINATVSAAGGTTPISTVSQPFATDNGVTFNFDRAMPVGSFVTGEQFVVSDQAFNITSITPASAQTNSAQANGTMKDPYVTNAGPQGFDEFMDSPSPVTLVYNTSANVDPGNTATSIAISLGEETTLVKSVRRASVTTDNEWQTIEKYVPLTVLSTSPPVGTFQPSMSGTTKTLYNVSDIDLTVFRSLTLPSPFTQTPAEILADLPLDPGNYGMNGEYIRRMRLDATAGHGLSTSNYAADIARAYGEACMVMHSDAYSDAQKQDLLYRLITWGIQLEGLDDRGWSGIGSVGGGAGQSFGWASYYYLTAFALQSSTMLAKVLAVSQPADNCEYIINATIDTAPGRTNSGDKGTPFFPEHENFPFCWPEVDIGSQFFGRYSFIAAFGMLWDYAPIALLQNGPASETGFSARNAGAYGAANNNSAVWAMNDRTITIDPWAATSRPPESTASVFWRDIVQPVGVYTHWTGVPDMLHQGNDPAYYGDNGDFFTATSGGYSWDFSGFDYATETKTGRAFRYSLDGTQWITDTGVSDTDSVSGLLPSTEHMLSFRWQSASGWGAWLPNYKVQADATASGVPNVISTTGAQSATTPSFTVNPTIHSKIKDNWGNNPGNWEPAPTTLGVDQVELKCGQGYVNGADNPTFTYLWKRNGSSLGVTTQTYTRVAADAGADITCTITPTNGAGGGSPYTTGAVTAPALTTLPAGTLIDTNFRGAFAVDYATEFAAATTNNATATHTPGGSISQVGMNVGYVRADKTGSAPSMTMPLQNSAVAGTTYDITAQVITTFPSFGTLGFEGTLTLSIRNATGTVFWFDQFNPSANSTEDIQDFVDSFSVGGGETDLDFFVRMENSSGSGGIDGGDPGVSLLTISAV